jgi:hypothetical protein
VIRYISYPRTAPPPRFAADIVSVFEKHRSEIDTTNLAKGLTSNDVLGVLAQDLIELGFQVEIGRSRADKIERPVFFGENGEATLRYQVDGYHPTWHCGLEIEAGRVWMGNAVYRDLIQACVMVEVDCLCLAVPQQYKYNSGGKGLSSRDYENTRDVLDALYGHSRVKLPYGLLLIGY